MFIRNATKKDCEIIASIGITTWVDTYAPEGMNQIYADYALKRFTAKNIAKLIELNDVYVAETKFGLAGYSVVARSSVGKHEIETMYVLPKFRKKGIGRMMLDKITSNIGGEFWLKCADDNLDAIAFYLRLGFIETGVTWFELDDEKYRCLVFELSSFQ